MTKAQLTIVQAGPQVSLQDAGRPRLMRYGVSASGPMDRFAFAIANLALGNKDGTPAIEISLGGLSLLCNEGPVSFCIAGGNFQVFINDTLVGSWVSATLQTGQRLSIRRGRWGSWCYLAFAGNVRHQPWLSSASTHGPTGLGGGHLVDGGCITIEDASISERFLGAIPCPVSARPRQRLRVVLGPQERFFTFDSIRAFLTEPFTLTDAYDRMGVRLAGPALHLNAPLDMPSEGILRGAVQVAGDGVATVLLADHQTTGGYPKIATILSGDLDGFVQNRSRATVQFQAVSAQEAVEIARGVYASRQRYCQQFATTRPTKM